MFGRKPKRLIIAERSTSMWSYHLRLVEPGKEMYGGGAGPALCGTSLGWDTRIPLIVYHNKTGSIGNYCEICSKIAIERKYEGYEEIQK